MSHGLIHRQVRTQAAAHIHRRNLVGGDGALGRGGANVASILHAVERWFYRVGGGPAFLTYRMRLPRVSVSVLPSGDGV